MAVGFGLLFSSLIQVAAEFEPPPRTGDIQIAVSHRPASQPALQIRPLPQSKRVALISLREDDPAQYTVTIDANTTYQRWEGFGASSMFYEENLTRMSEPAQSEVYDLIFKDLGATLLGIRPYSQFQPREGASYNWGSMASQRAILAAAKARGVISKVWARISSPPGWMKDNGSAINGGHVLPQYYTAFAAYCRDYLLGMRDIYGFPIYAFSIFNEPGNAHPYETTTTSPEEFRDILKIVGADFDAHGLGAVKLMAPDSPMLNLNDNYTGRNYLSPLANDATALGYLNIIAVHSYDDKAGRGPWVESRDAAAAAGKPIWQTEVCNLSASTQHNITGACWGSWWAHRALNIGNVTAWHWWQYYYPEDPTIGDSGLVEIVNPTTYHVHPRYYMFKQWARNIKPGAVRISTSSDCPDLHVTAFKDGQTIIIVATNYRYQGGAQTVSATFQCGSIAGSVRHIRTSETESYSTQPDIVPSGQAFTVTIPALTVNTFLLTMPATPGAPVARFSATPLSGHAPLTVAFTDASTDTPTRWAWDFDGDGTDDSSAQNPSYTYSRAGTYTVKLTAANASGSGSLVLANYITAIGAASTTTTTATTTTGPLRSTTSTSTTTTTTLPPGQGSTLDFAQVVAGGPYRSFLTLTNPGETAASANVLFRQPSGDSLVLIISGVSGSSRVLTIPAKGFVRLTLEDTGHVIKTGWCQVHSSTPINGVLIYQLADSQGVISEAAVFPSPRALAFTLPVPQLGAESLTGLALAAVDSQPTQITLRFFRQEGVVQGRASFTLPPGSQVSRFVSEFIPGLAAAQEGMMEITADRNLIAVALLFQGNVFTAIPVSPRP
jgi:PKD repeat protein